ncbi:MAG: ABC transporter permease subunit [Lachnospiraceae bacterium]|jgi:putative aldouronate transport system permease protein
MAKLKYWAPVFMMMLPGLIYLFINNYIPMGGLIAAFKQVNFADGIYGSPWADPWYKNFTTKDAFVITRNTILYNFAFILVNNIFGIIIAIFISDVRSKAAKKVYQSAVLFPFLMSMVIVSYIVFALLSNENGMLNKSILPMLGMEPVSWYITPEVWPVILVVVNFWKGVGYGCLIYIAAIAGIDKATYEAAQIDSASRFQIIRNITLPSLVPSIITLVMLSVSKIFFSDFGLFYQVPQNSGAVFSTTNTIDTYVYRALLEQNNSSMSAAAGFYQSVVGFALVLAVNALVRRFSRENALF